ncbi:bridging integrator 2, partial [Austrofundulus limnaeus]|uniref:Bridging integrator 2 n=1 Tax=Austrofundulus limnaeus TaxID=52670 RepID=A0A2I4B3U3_AUSLI
AELIIALFCFEVNERGDETGDLKSEEVSLRDRPEKTSSQKEEVLNQGSRKPSNEEKRGRPSTKGRKVFSNSPTPERHQKQGNGPPSSSRPVRSQRPLSGSLASGARPSGSQIESRVFYSGFNVSDNKSSPRRRASRSPAPVIGAPVGSVSGRKQVSQGLLSRQPPTAQIRSRPDQSLFQAPVHQGSSYLYTHSNLQPQVSPQGPIPKVQAAPEQEEGRGLFNLPFSRLYNFRGLRDKWTKPATQSRKSSTGAPVKEPKSPS